MADEADSIGDVPPEVLTFLQNAEAVSDSCLRINVLKPAESREYSATLQRSSIGRALGLVALIDSNDSNPYCYISRGIARGMVVYFSHDPEPEIHFPNSERFEAALAAGRERGLDIDEVPRDPLHCEDNALFSNAIDSLAEVEGEDSEALICLFMPLLNPRRLPTIESLARHRSFFVRESVANFIAAHPRPEHREVAARLAADRHPQVSRRGIQALNSAKREFHAAIQTPNNALERTENPCGALRHCEPAPWPAAQLNR